jgi:hypothetical protein
MLTLMEGSGRKLFNVPDQMLVVEGAGELLNVVCCPVLLSACSLLRLQKLSEMYSVERGAFYLRKRRLQTKQCRLQGKTAGIL